MLPVTVTFCAARGAASALQIHRRERRERQRSWPYDKLRVQRKLKLIGGIHIKNPYING